jgi:hypothetical protein
VEGRIEVVKKELEAERERRGKAELKANAAESLVSY